MQVRVAASCHSLLRGLLVFERFERIAELALPGGVAVADSAERACCQWSARPSLLPAVGAPKRAASGWRAQACCQWSARPSVLTAVGALERADTPGYGAADPVHTGIVEIGGACAGCQALRCLASMRNPGGRSALRNRPAVPSEPKGAVGNQPPWRRDPIRRRTDHHGSGIGPGYFGIRQFRLRDSLRQVPGAWVPAFGYDILNRLRRVPPAHLLA